METIHVTDSEVESEEVFNSLDDEHNGKEVALELPNILDKSILTAEETSPRQHLSTTELDQQSNAR